MIILSINNFIFNIFNKKEKLFFFIIIISQVFLSCFELLSLGSLIPVFNTFIDEGIQYFQIPIIKVQVNLNILFILISLLFIFKNIYFLTLAFFSIKFRNFVTKRIVAKLYESYLKKSYSFHIQNHSAVLLRNIQVASSLDSILQRLISFYADLILFLVAILVVSIFNFNLTFGVLGVAGIILLIFYKFTIKKIKKYGEGDLDNSKLFLKNILDGLKAFKEILLSNKQNFFTNKSKFFHNNVLNFKLKFSLTEMTAKPLLETLIILFGLLFVFFMINNYNISFKEILPYLIVLILATIKILPGILRIFQSLQQFKFLLPQIKLIDECLVAVKKDTINTRNEIDFKPVEFKEEIKLKNINLKFNKKCILENLNINIKKNSTIAIMGDSGSGKTSLLNIITGLIKPTNGEIEIDGKQVDLFNNHWMKKIGYVFQNTHLIDSSIMENIAFGYEKDKINITRVNECIKVAELENFVKSEKEGLNTLVGENGSRLSGGQLQRIGLARAFYKNPELLILDEATSSLDNDNEINIMNTFAKLKKKLTIIIVSHRLKPLELADEVYKIKNKKIIPF